ncbi:fibrinogen-like protein 1 [Mercenaria mercenaria]|uniref:fibrinogen-like protein 1 n=1 Tax=Mercenaria mercenaria TaxID=6596 RepID=UPI00234F347C|nr:fibrinogen-like protein 1 [Mercenaria mercenaria]
MSRYCLTAKMQTGSIVFLISIYVCFGEGISVKNVNDKLKYNDCDDVLRSGSYRESGNYVVFLNSSEPLQVYCNFESVEARTPIMQQKYGRENFQRYWHDYEYGFGNAASGDFWMGLKHMKRLTDTGFNVLTVTLQDCKNTIKVIRYNYFRLGPAYQRYPLRIGSYVSSSVLPDDFYHNNGMQFATIDRPDHHNCATHQRGGWWYNYCSFSLPTGRYYIGCYYKPSGGFYDGIYYKDWHGFGYSLKYIKMELSLY